MRLQSHVHLSGVSVEVDKEESVSLKDSVLNGSSVSLDENTPLITALTHLHNYFSSTV